jgi:hypothetical protein
MPLLYAFYKTCFASYLQAVCGTKTTALPERYVCATVSAQVLNKLSEVFLY